MGSTLKFFATTCLIAALICKPIEVRAVEIGCVGSQCPNLRLISNATVLTAVRATFILLLPPFWS